MERFFVKAKNFIKKNSLLPKTVCLALALALWGYISNSKIGELQFKVPITFENLPNNMSVSQISTKYASVIVYGKSDQMSTFQAKNIKAVVDLKRPKVGVMNSYPIQIHRNEIPEPVRVEAKEANVDILVEQYITKRLRIVPVLTGSVASGFSVGSVKVKPEFVRVKGVPSVLGELVSVNTEDISVEGAEKDITIETGLKKDKLSSAEFSEELIQVIVPVSSEGALTLSVQASVKNSLQGYDAALAEAITATVAYKSISKAQLKPEDLEVFVDVLELKDDESVSQGKSFNARLPLRYSFKKAAADLEVISISPYDAEVALHIKQKAD